MGRFQFSKASEFQLASIHPDLQRVLRRALSTGVIDFTIVVGFRGEAAQNKAFAEGNSTKRWPDGEHNKFPSDAVDVAPVLPPTVLATRIPWKDARYWFWLAGVILAAAAEEGVALRYGFDWDGDFDLDDQKLKDLGHFERAR